MALTVNTTATIQIAFTLSDDGVPVYSDAFYFPVGQVPSNAELRALAIDRYQAWRAIVTAPPRELTLAEKIERFRDRLRERLRLQAEIEAEDPAVVAAAQG